MSSCVVGLFAMSISPSGILRNLKVEESFYFFTSIGNYTGQSATSLDEFLLKIKDVNLESLEFHLYRQDFENWASLSLGDDRLADEIKRLREADVKGKAIRDGLYLVVSSRLQDLKSVSIGKKSELLAH
jgi:hypothetical protein